MVPGQSAKKGKGASAPVDYLIHILEIKPWPPSQSLRSLRSVLIQWEHGNRSSGSTNVVVPTLGSVIGEGKIEFNESFKLRATLLRVGKGKDADTFQKNCMEFNLCEPRRDKAQVLATAVVDLADYGIVNETISLSVPMNSKRSFRNTSQPILYIKIQPVDKSRSSSSLMDAMFREVSVDKNHGESVSALMNEEYAEEAEGTTFTDDDVSSHSSLTNGGLAQSEETGREIKIRVKGVNRKPAVGSRTEDEKCMPQPEDLKRNSSCSSSIDLSSELESPVNGHASVLNHVDSRVSILNEEADANMRSNAHQDLIQGVNEKVDNKFTFEDDTHTNGNLNTSNVSPAKVASSHHIPLVSVEPNSSKTDDFGVIDKNDSKAQANGKLSLEETGTDDDTDNSSVDDMDGKRSLGDDSFDNYPQGAARNEGLFGETRMNGSILRNDRLKHVKSVRSPSDSVRTNGLVSRNHHHDLREVVPFGDMQNDVGNPQANERKSAKIYPKDIRTSMLDGKIQNLEHKVMMLEGELREAAAIEAALYSIVAEHGSSVSKVHAPARRLSRLYLHACKESFPSRRASAARSAVSGLVLVAKACGNDVPRLTFWLSNCAVLRAIISQTNSVPEMQETREHTERNGSAKWNKTTPSSLTWKAPTRKENKSLTNGDISEWEDLDAFTSALERVEAWIFSRIVESIWWQILTPHMQSAATKAIDKVIGSDSMKNLQRTTSSGDQGQGNFSMDLWKEAFKDACERLCPVRAGGHECGCLPVLVRLVMEQCVARLDVAMFNAILRESADEIPTDPVSDPISDSKVLPIPAGKSSFGAGAQLKNAIGNWSRCLTDLFGMDDDDDDANEDDSGKDENDGRQDFKSFHLLNALSDLMMLPKDMLLSKSIRKEVCPAFGAPLIKKVLDYFVPDEFCPDSIPDAVMEALDCEDALDDEEDSLTAIPCIAPPPSYTPPLAATIANITIGEIQPQLTRSGSSLLRKSYTSDDELDELNSPLASILQGSCVAAAPPKPSWKRKENGIRYELLKDVWANSE